MPTALITGANRGLGFEFTNQYAAEGWRIFAACRDPAGAIALQNMPMALRDTISIISMDVTDSDSVRTAAATLKEVAIDVLINSAGITGTSGQSTGHVDYGGCKYDGSHAPT